MISDYRAVMGLFQELDAVISENVNPDIVGYG
jgi:hypothetical protein